MNTSNFPPTYDDALWLLNDSMRRAVDGSSLPLFVDALNQRVIIGSIVSTGKGAPLQVQSGDMEITTSGKGLVLNDDGGSGKACRITATYDAPTGNWNLTLTTI